MAVNAKRVSEREDAQASTSGQEPAPIASLDRKAMIQQSSELNSLSYESSAHLSRGPSSAQLGPSSAGSSIHRPQREGSFSNSPWHAEYVFDENGGILPQQPNHRRAKEPKAGKPCRVS